MNIHENLERVKRTIARSAEKVGRNPNDVKLIVVTKNHDVDEIKKVIGCGHNALGENRFQEAKSKIEQLPDTIEWHFIGYLQTNKAKYVARMFHMIHSLDRLHLAEALNKAAENLNTTLQCLVEVNVAGEESKFGIDPEHTIELVRQVSEQYDRIRILGLMCMAPYVDDPETIRPVFRGLRELRDRISQLDLTNVDMRHLSMGMTNDYPVAVQEGATMVRIGTAIFS